MDVANLRRECATASGRTERLENTDAAESAVEALLSNSTDDTAG